MFAVNFKFNEIADLQYFIDSSQSFDFNPNTPGLRRATGRANCPTTSSTVSYLAFILMWFYFFFTRSLLTIYSIPNQPPILLKTKLFHIMNFLLSFLLVEAHMSNFTNFSLSLILYSGNLCPTHGLVVLLLQVHWFCGLHLFRAEKEDKSAVHPSHNPSLHHAHLLLVWSKGGHYKPILLRLLFKMCCYAAILLVVQSLCKKGM